jgi:hypothetical protein
VSKTIGKLSKLFFLVIVNAATFVISRDVYANDLLANNCASEPNLGKISLSFYAVMTSPACSTKAASGSNLIAIGTAEFPTVIATYLTSDDLEDSSSKEIAAKAEEFVKSAPQEIKPKIKPKIELDIKPEIESKIESNIKAETKLLSGYQSDESGSYRASANVNELSKSDRLSIFNLLGLAPTPVTLNVDTKLLDTYRGETPANPLAFGSTQVASDSIHSSQGTSINRYSANSDYYWRDLGRVVDIVRNKDQTKDWGTFESDDIVD